MSNSRIALSTIDYVLKELIWNTPGSKSQHLSLFNECYYISVQVRTGFNIGTISFYQHH
jgi:hypothetical protein